MMGVVILVLVTGVAFFGIKKFMSKHSQTEHDSTEPHYENQSGAPELRANSPRGGQVHSSTSPKYENYPADGLLHSNNNTGMMYEHSEATGIAKDDSPYENPDGLNGPLNDIPYENPDDLNLNHPTDNNMYENPDAATSEYMTIPESNTASENDPTVLASHYQNVGDTSNAYDTINMEDISPNINTYEAIRN